MRLGRVGAFRAVISTYLPLPIAIFPRGDKVPWVLQSVTTRYSNGHACETLPLFMNSLRQSYAQHCTARFHVRGNGIACIFCPSLVMSDWYLIGLKLARGT